MPERASNRIRQRVPCRVEDVRVEEGARCPLQLVTHPPKSPDGEKRIPEVGHGVHPRQLPVEQDSADCDDANSRLEASRERCTAWQGSRRVSVWVVEPVACTGATSPRVRPTARSGGQRPDGPAGRPRTRGRLGAAFARSNGCR